jgi:hypothetical protein
MECLAMSINPSAPSPSGKSGRFVLLWHELDHIPDRQSHFDLMIEHAGEFITLELLQWPSEIEPIRGRFLPAHRLAYWELEGPISNNRGSVSRMTRGSYETNFFEPGLWRLALSSDNLTAQIELRWKPQTEMAELLTGGLIAEIVTRQWSAIGIHDPLSPK